jgi:hypothetical protein
VRGNVAAVGLLTIVAVACVFSYLTSTTNTDILVAQPVAMDMVPLKPAGNNMPVVYVMEPVQSERNTNVLSTPSSATKLAEVQPVDLSNLPESVAFPLPNNMLNAKSSAQDFVATRKPVAVRKPKSSAPVPTAQDLRFERAYPVETEKQAVRRAKILARQEYLQTYQTAIKVPASPAIINDIPAISLLYLFVYLVLNWTL